MTYAVSVDTRIAPGASEMDELQRIGAGALLEDGFESVQEIAGPDGMEVKLRDTFVGVYPGGALLKVFVDAPALEFAEEAVRELVEELLERTELLADWAVDRCQVELHPDLAKESLDAADGPDAPPNDVGVPPRTPDGPGRGEDARRTHGDGGGNGRDPHQDPDHGPEAGGVRGGDVRGVDARGRGRWGDRRRRGLGHLIWAEDAELAAGALIWGMDVLLDELFQDAHALDREGTNVAECDVPMWLLDELPARYALQYDARFARRFLVTAIALTTRLTEGSFVRLSCVAEELALRLLLPRGRGHARDVRPPGRGRRGGTGMLRRPGLRGQDHEWLDDDADEVDDEENDDEDNATEALGIATWFTPFDERADTSTHTRRTSPRTGLRRK